eukprot:TRINITY_DN1185_c0_g1::TRINITY_DN1185_c0_g1_i1::g.17372::m.17372 TRINITY_DN1185_c0_g1::TRINITY_DN1185_c0_g1_i1::g.17372  ORF type:complete len:717 (+),score=295.00,sp/Q9CZD3/GARS_MOUSE/51.73/0.0,tRNA-synt_2b/PF00587.20/8.9e-57,HGTP_anticodon/PF03129.15/3.3e+03,HGTP_anticodon/PF03129.15/2e+03,HGTP_anticodon/PF03129.15/1.2e-22,WHEP-TRS/PF00458.15/4.4e-12,WHEP-TRS/PF00458.15/2.9e+03 TRINITY_DN1185_c0_g1_i1:297-2153(+)
MKNWFKRDQFETLMRRRYFIVPSFEIYGGIGGLYDLGPPLCAIKANFLSLWRQHFVLSEGLLEIQGTCLTPDPVLRASGHVDKFTDFMVKDVKTSDPYRADHLLIDFLEKKLKDPTTGSADEREEWAQAIQRADEFNCEEITALFKKYNIKAPETGNDLTDPYEFNLMFGTSIGPSGLVPGYLRPETAQGIFVNFKRLLDYNGNQMPFGAAQVGLAFRNEISPRSGLLRVREFEMAEIEFFVHPEKKQHPKFDRVKDLELALFAREQQLTTRKPIMMTVGEAVSKGIINNQTLGYFLARTALFMFKIGIRKERLRFRQHLEHEMAHYASDCWDAEIETSYGWVECVGHADRACFDLSVHSEKAKVDLVAYEAFDEPKIVDVVEVEPNKGAIGKTFKKEAQVIIQYLASLQGDVALKLKADLEKGAVEIRPTCNDQKFKLTKDMVAIEQKQKKITGRNITPSVIEPSFGIGRILYSLLEHSYWVREGEDEARAVLSLPPHMAPIKCSVLPLSNNPEFDPFVAEIAHQLLETGISHKVDTSSVSIGKRYARTDEIGVPFGITVDFTTVEDRTVTLRDRDSCEQIRASITDAINVVKSLCNGTATWDDVKTKYPAVLAKQE